MHQPALAAADLDGRSVRGHLTGVVLVSSAEAEVLEWRHGELLFLARVAADAATPQPATPPRALRERRARDRRRRFVAEAANRVGEIAHRRGWDRVVVSGGDVLTRPLVRALPAPLRAHATRDARHLIDLDSGAVARIVSDLVE
jgi:hypothetical protein